MSARSLALVGPVRLRLGLHLGEAGVVVRELVEVGPRDLRRHDDVIAGHVRFRIARAVLELDVHPHPELLEPGPRSVPVDADPLTRGTRLVEGKACVRSQALNTRCPTGPPRRGTPSPAPPNKSCRVRHTADSECGGRRQVSTSTSWASSPLLRPCPCRQPGERIAAGMSCPPT